MQSILIILTFLDRSRNDSSFLLDAKSYWCRRKYRADEAAKRAARSRCTRFLPSPASDFFPACLSHICDTWQEEWDSACSSKLKSIKPRLVHWPSALINPEEKRLLFADFELATPLPPTGICYAESPSNDAPAAMVIFLHHMCLFLVMVFTACVLEFMGVTVILWLTSYPIVRYIF